METANFTTDGCVSRLGLGRPPREGFRPISPKAKALLNYFKSSVNQGYRVTKKDISFLFTVFSYCTRLHDPPISFSPNLWRSDMRCGSQFPLPNGMPGQCDPNANANGKGPCCSAGSYCGNSWRHCAHQDFRGLDKSINLGRLISKVVFLCSRTTKNTKDVAIRWALWFAIPTTKWNAWPM